MDTVTHERENLSRFSTDPMLDGTGKPIVATIRATDRAKFHALAEYPLLSAADIAALTDSDAKSITHRFNLLKRRPNMWVAVAAHQLDKPLESLHEPLIYTLTDRSTSLCLDHKVPVRTEEFTGPFDHRLDSIRVRASFALGAKHSATAEILSWQTLIEMGKIPAATLQAKSPTLIKINIVDKKGAYRNMMRADTFPFVIQGRQERPKRYFIMGIEIDRGTESIRSYGYNESHIRTKFAQWIYAFEHELWSQFGFPNGSVIFLTTSDARVHTMMDLLLSMTEHNPVLRRRFLFETYKSEVDAGLFTKPYQRAGLQPLLICQP